MTQKNEKNNNVTVTISGVCERAQTFYTDPI